MLPLYLALGLALSLWTLADLDMPRPRGADWLIVGSLGLLLTLLWLPLLVGALVVRWRSREHVTGPRSLRTAAWYCVWSVALRAYTYPDTKLEPTRFRVFRWLDDRYLDAIRRDWRVRLVVATAPILRADDEPTLPSFEAPAVHTAADDEVTVVSLQDWMRKRRVN